LILDAWGKNAAGFAACFMFLGGAAISRAATAASVMQFSSRVDRARARQEQEYARVDETDAAASRDIEMATTLSGWL
jgi:hypothetical protein